MAKKKTMGMAVLFVAFLFFSNPNISIIDLLPDFIGYILLCIGLSKVADLSDSIASALSTFRKMILIDAGKWLALVWVFGISAPTEQNSSLLLWSFVFAVVEMLCLIPAYHKLFGGLNQLGYFYPNNSIFTEKSGRKKNLTDRIRTLTISFVTVKAVLSFLPELADLTNHSYDEGSAWVNMYRYIGVMRVMAFLPVLIFGFIWLVRIELYFLRLCKDQTLMAALTERYKTEILPKIGLFVRRRFRMIGATLLIAFLLTIDFHLEHRNMLPDALAAIFFLVTFFLLDRQFHQPKRVWIPLGIAFLFSTYLTQMTENRFFDRFTYSAIIKSDEARTAYTELILATVLQSLLMVALMALLMRALFFVIHAHTGFVLGKEHAGKIEEKMIEGIHGELRRSVILGFVTTVIYALADIIYLFFAPEFGFVGIIRLCIAAICIVTVVRSISAIQQALDTKYMLE